MTDAETCPAGWRCSVLARLVRERDAARRSLAFAECRSERRDFVTTERAKEWAARAWGAEEAERLFSGGGI